MNQQNNQTRCEEKSEIGAQSTSLTSHELSALQLIGSNVGQRSLMPRGAEILAYGTPRLLDKGLIRHDPSRRSAYALTPAGRASLEADQSIRCSECGLGVPASLHHANFCPWCAAAFAARRGPVQTRICSVCNTVHDLPLCPTRSRITGGAA